MLDDYRTADIDPGLRAMLGFLAKLTGEPESVGADDIAALREAGLSDEAIEDAALICAAFHMITRLADAFEFELLDAAGYARGADMLLRRGYA